MLESNLLVMLSAHAFASFGFGLSLLAMWLRWLASTAVFKASLVRLGKFSDTGHHCASPSLATMSRAAIHITAPLRRDSMSAPSEVTPNQRSVRRLPPQHAEQPPPTLPLATPSDLNSEGLESLDSTPTESNPTESLSLPSTPVVAPNLPINPLEREKLLRRRSNSTSSLLLKVKSPFRARDKRFSLPVVLPEQAPPLLPMNKTTRMAIAVSTLKVKRARTPWHLSRESSSTTTSGSEHSHDSKSSRRNFLGFHRRSHDAPHSDSRSARKTSHSAKPPRTLPYEAPYFANPPLLSQESQFRSRERNCSEYS